MSELNLKIDLQAIKIGITREKKIYDNYRKRKTGEKYFRQSIKIYNKKGEFVDSGFVQINDYTDMCNMVRVCNKSKKSFHLFERWEYYGSEIYKTDSFTIIDLITGNTIGTLTSNYVSEFVKDMTDLGYTCCVGDLKKDEYSKILLDCLNEYSDLNNPIDSKFKQMFNELKEESCDCNLIEILDIYDLFKKGEISEERKNTLLDILKCECKNKQLEPDLTEKDQERIYELKLKAQDEISDFFEKKEE